MPCIKESTSPEDAGNNPDAALNQKDVPGMEIVSDSSNEPTPDPEPAVAMSAAATQAAFVPTAIEPATTLLTATALRDQDSVMSDSSVDDEISDTESEMDREDEREAIMLAKAAELYLGNEPKTGPPSTDDQQDLPVGNFTNQELLESMYKRRERLVQRMVSAMRFHAIAGKEAQEANIKAYDEAQRLLEDLERQIERCEKAFRMLASLPGKRLSLEALAAPVKEVVEPTPAIAIPTAVAVQDPRQFLDQLKHMVMPFVGKELFDANCDRYLSYLVINEYHQQCLEFEFNKKRQEGKTLTWEECEIVFLKIALSEQERVKQIKTLLETGREEHESYRQFAMRIARDMRLYGIKDDNEMVLSLLSATVTPDTFNMMVTRLQVLNQSAEMRFTSISDFTKIMSNLIGPLAANAKKAYATA
ncbi:hypothetical protein BGZ68_000786, partial [Mortierella alpina]